MIEQFSRHSNKITSSVTLRENFFKNVTCVYPNGADHLQAWGLNRDLDLGLISKGKKSST